MPLKTQRTEAPTLNLTPMIDIVFLLIIFFMVGTKFTDLERKIELTVPEVSDVTPLSAAPERRIINVYRDGRISIDRRTVTLDELRDELVAARGEYQDLGVVIRGDAEVELQTVVNTFEACRRAGISEMGISVRLARRDP